jgi:hypothetical protein
VNHTVQLCEHPPHLRRTTQWTHRRVMTTRVVCIGCNVTLRYERQTQK